MCVIIMSQCAACSMGGLRAYRRIGAVSHLPDWFAFNFVERREGGPVAMQHDSVGCEGGAGRRLITFSKRELSTAEGDIATSVASSGLALNDATVRDGNCGLDALLGKPKGFGGRRSYT